MTNVYHKYVPNVFLAKCDQEYKKGDIIQLTTKHEQEHDCVVYNLIEVKNGFWFYSIIRNDGFNTQEMAKNKAEKLNKFSLNATVRASNYFEQAMEGREFLILGEPIKVGHHSEKRHRALIERNHKRTTNAHIELEKSDELQRRAEYWERRAEMINLSMPESLEYFEFKLEQAKQHHAGLKDGTIERAHGMSLQYANKRVKDMQKNYDLAVKLWQ